ncbi:hypothetical protein [Brachyspira pilosicoli]|uniref:hypothetical protein n=1 Tax=Brachyspira pilosicoli TaxID=52584 RepID=UPI0030046728
MSENIRWKQRFNHFEKAFNLLKSVFEDRKIEELSLLKKKVLFKDLNILMN